MKADNIILTILTVCAVCSCYGTVDVDVTPELVDVTLEIAVPVQAKADSPLIPDVENLIYDVWILQYDKMGLLLDAGTGHYRADMSTGSLAATVVATLAAVPETTICMLANLDRGVPVPTRVWPQTLTEFKTSVGVVDLTSDIVAANMGTLTDMPMSGYWEGDIASESAAVQVSLGRMLTRINLTLVNKSASSYVLNSLQKVSKQVYAFPSINHDPLPDEAYHDVALGVSIDAGATKELHFYAAPNFTADGTNATKLVVDGKEPVILSNGAPADDPRDYNLYHNSNYTFTININ